MTGDQLRWVAHLARLEFEDSELVVFTEQLSRIVEYIDQLESVNTEGVEPLAHALPIHNVFRPDELGTSLSVEEALANAPNRKDEFYSVPAVLE